MSRARRPVAPGRRREIIPFNWPPIHTGGKLAPALAVGNIVALKPSEQGSTGAGAGVAGAAAENITLAVLVLGMTCGQVGESITQGGEEVVMDEGKETGRYDLLPHGQSQRPAGGSTWRSFTGVDPRETITDDASADQAG
jgi:hypothetical protein